MTATTATKTTAEAVAEFEAQGAIDPGTEGWWRVWGAQPRHIRPGDLVVDADGWFLVTEAGPSTNGLQFGVVTAEGERFWFGLLHRVNVVRRGTKNTLAK